MNLNELERTIQQAEEFFDTQLKALDRDRKELSNRLCSDSRSADQLASNWARFEEQYAFLRGQWVAYRVMNKNLKELNLNEA